MRYFLKIALIIFSISLLTLFMVDRGSKEELLLLATMGLTGVIIIVSAIKIRIDEI